MQVYALVVEAPGVAFSDDDHAWAVVSQYLRAAEVDALWPLFTVRGGRQSRA